MDFLNIALMVMSAVVAWLWPFETFLIVYGALGPLHYLTEISWLHDRGWFGTSHHDWIVPALAALGGVLAFVGGLGAVTLALPSATMQLSLTQFMTLVALGAGFGAAFAVSAVRKIVYGMAVVLLGAALLQSEAGRLLVGVFLLTLIHVLLFTSLFMLQGALKSRRAIGYVSWGVHLGLPVTILAIGWSDMPTLSVSAEALQRSAPMHDLLLAVCRIFRMPEDVNHATVAMQMVAYAYTYHYLNWFSKVQIIRWHDMPRRRLEWIAGTWVLMVALYLVDWMLGFVVSLGLSVAHVYLELPLNWRTLASVTRGVADRIASRAGTPAVSHSGGSRP